MPESHGTVLWLCHDFVQKQERGVRNKRKGGLGEVGGIVCSAKRTGAVVQDKDYLYMLLKCALLTTVKFIEAFKKLYYNKKKDEPRFARSQN